MKIDRSKVRELFLKNLKDNEIADKLNCKPLTISRIRTEELQLFKHSQFYMKEYRRAYFNKAALQTSIYLPITMMNKLKFNREDIIYYRMTFEEPNRLILDFKFEKDIYDKDNIKKRRCLKSTNNAKNAVDLLKPSEDL